MEKLFLLRHALDEGYEGDPFLCERGIEQARELAESIALNLNGDNEDITIWTSPSKRTKGTALIIWEKFPKATFVEHEKLWSDEDHSYDFDWLENQLNNFHGKILIIISHLEYVCYFPEKKLGFKDIRASCAGGLLIENGKQSYFD